MKSNSASRKNERHATQEKISEIVLAPASASREASCEGERFQKEVETTKTEANSSLYPSGKVGSKSHRSKHDCGHYNSDNESSEYEDKTEPGAFDIVGPQADSHPDVDENQATLAGTDLLDEASNDRAMLVEAKLAPELTSAEEINIQEEEEMIVKKKQYKRVLWFAMLFYALAIIGNIVSFVLLFVNPPPAFGRLYFPLLNGLIEAAFLVVVATIVILIPTRGCCRSSIRLEEYAPHDKELLREAQIASIASLCLFTVVAIPIIVLLPDLQWLGYAFMTWFFAGTVFTLSRVQVLRRSIEARHQKSKFFWFLFLAFFLGLTGATIWRCWNPLYPDCTVPRASWIGDGECDGEPYTSEMCGYDGGDCIQFFEDYPGCVVEYPYWIADGTCDAGAYNTLECGYDGGDCVADNGEYPDCIVPNPSWIGDGKCDGRLYGTVECGFDGGDCLGPGERCGGHRECASDVCNSVTKVCDSAFVSDLYPNCSVGIPDWIGDGECDGGYYASEACGFDGGDCLKLDEPCLQDKECASGFCHADTKMCYLGVLEKYPDCVVEYPVKIGDGVCDGGEYATAACGYDGGDCVNPFSQNSSSMSPTVFPTFHMTTAIAVLLCLQLFFA